MVEAEMSLSARHVPLGSLVTRIHIAAVLLLLTLCSFQPLLADSKILLNRLGPKRVTPTVPHLLGKRVRGIRERHRLGRILRGKDDFFGAGGRDAIAASASGDDARSSTDDRLSLHDLSTDGKKFGLQLPLDITPTRRETPVPASVNDIQPQRSGKGNTNIRLSALSWGAPTALPVTYHGGVVMSQPMTLYLVFYGNWSKADTQRFFDFTNSISSNSSTQKNVPNVKHWWSLVRKYGQKDGKLVTDQVKLGKAILDKDFTSGPGRLLSNYEQDIVTIVNFYLINKIFPSDSNAVYMVLTDPTVTVASPKPDDGFCTHFCGYHSYGQSLNGKVLKFGFVGHASHCPKKCIRQLDFDTVNGMALDATVSTFAHELSEAAYDPMFTAWYDKQGSEAADKCSFLYGNGWLTADKKAYNMAGVGKTRFLVQAMLDAKSNKCVQ